MSASKRVSRKLPFFGAAAVALLVILWAYRPRPVVVEVARVERGPLKEEVVEEGKTRLRDRFVVHAPVTGTVERIELEPGMRVKAGQPLARMHPSDAPLLDPATRAAAVATVGAAREHLSSARAQLRRSASARRLIDQNARRTQTLVKGGALPPQESERAVNQTELAAAEEEAAGAAVRAAEEDLRRAQAAAGQRAPSSPDARTVVSPADALVLRVREPSEAVVAGGAPLLELGDVNALEVLVPLLTRDAVRVRPGMRVWLERWGDGRALPGAVRWVEPSAETKVSPLGVEEQRVNVVVDLEEPSPLGDGFAVDARIVVWEGKEVPQLPLSAVFRHGDGWAVYALRGGRAKLADVKLGHRGERAFELLSGLSEGDEVIVHPPEAVNDGARVRAK